MNTITGINQLIDIASSKAKANGWDDDMPRHDDPNFPLWVTTKLMLVNSELVEAMEELRAGHDVAHIYSGDGGKPEGFLVEIADAFIRLGHLVGAVAEGADLETLITEKIRYNDARGKRHGGKVI